MGKVRCPGSIKTTVPEPLERKCPKCGSIVEIWSDEEKADCKCGATVFKDVKMTCVVWCSAAEECVGDIVDVKKIKAEAKKNADKCANFNALVSLNQSFVRNKAKEMLTSL